MKINNKGYSLTELLLTLVVFGFVMLGIATIMRTTSVSYKDGDAQVTLQTEAQIVANQIEELLVDAQLYNAVEEKYFSSGIFNGDKYLVIKATNALTHYIVLDDAQKRLYYQQNGTGDGNWSLMAEYVSAIDIDGYSTVTTDANCDNMVTLKVTLDKQGYEYTAVKEVFFRNAVEDNTVMQIQAPVGGAPGAGEVVKTVEIERYELLSLKDDCGLDTSKTFTVGDGSPDALDDFDDYFEFVDVSFSTDNTDLLNTISSVTSKGNNPTGFIRTKSTVDVDFTKYVQESDGIVIKGTDINNKAVTIKLTLKTVSYDVTKTKTAQGFIKVTSRAGDLERYDYIDVQGINVAGMLNSKLNSVPANRTIKFKMVAYRDTGDLVYASTERMGDNAPNLETLSTVGGEGRGWQLCGGSNPTLNLGLAVDKVTGDLVIQAKPCTYNSEFANGNIRVAVAVYLPNNVSSNGSVQVLDFNVYQQGDSMEKYKGGNSYSATTADAELKIF